MSKYEEYLDYDDEAKGSFPINCRRPNAHGGLSSNPSFTLEWEGRLDIGMSNSVTTSIRGLIRDTAIGRTKTTDRADRATVVKVFDFRTSCIMRKVEHRDVYKKLHGCISTGKEANVYHAISSGGQELAIEVFKTSVMDFKDRAKYLGDFRFKGVLRTKNPRKMMKMLAEK